MIRTQQLPQEDRIVILLEAEGLEDVWAKGLRAHHPNAEIRYWPDWGDLSEGDYLIAWKLPHGTLSQATNLKAILSVGAGVDQLLEDPSFPRDVPLVRLVDPTLNVGMIEYVSMAVLTLHRDALTYFDQCSRGEWNQIPQVLPHNRRVGMMGLGRLARSCLGALENFGFDLAAWGPSDVDPHERVRSYRGLAELPDFLSRTEILVVLTPLNVTTKGILDRQALSRLPAGASIVNVARGAILDETAARDLLNQGHLSRVWLDVFEHEPLPAGHWAWKHPRAVVTPHIAAATLPESAARIVGADIARFQSGQTVENIVNPEGIV